MKLALLLFFLGTHSTFSFAKPFELCQSLFTSSKELKYHFKSDSKLKEFYSKQLFENIYQKIENFPTLSKKEKQNFIFETEKIISYIEKHPNNTRLKQLNELLSESIRSVPLIAEFIKTHKIPPFLDTHSLFKVILTLFTKYSHSYLTHSSPKKLDWTRLYILLSAVKDFQKQKSAFVLYKILRHVKEKHSIEEYLNCI